MKRSLIVLSVVSLVFAGVASAEVRKGDVFLDILAGWTQQKLSDDVTDTLENVSGQSVDDSIDVFFGTVRPGVALTDNIRVAGVFSLTIVDSDLTDITAWSLGASGEYVFMPANQFNPYVGGMLAWMDADVESDLTGIDFDADGFMFGPRVGFLYTLNTTNNLFGEFQYLFYSGDLDDVLDDGFMVLFGIEHKFKVGQ